MEATHPGTTSIQPAVRLSEKFVVTDPRGPETTDQHQYGDWPVLRQKTSLFFILGFWITTAHVLSGRAGGFDSETKELPTAIGRIRPHPDLLLQQLFQIAELFSLDYQPSKPRDRVRHRKMGINEQPALSERPILRTRWLQDHEEKESRFEFDSEFPLEFMIIYLPLIPERDAQLINLIQFLSKVDETGPSEGVGH